MSSHVLKPIKAVTNALGFGLVVSAWAFAAFNAVAWMTLYPSIGVLWLLGWLH